MFLADSWNHNICLESMFFDIFCATMANRYRRSSVEEHHSKRFPNNSTLTYHDHFFTSDIPRKLFNNFHNSFGGTGHQSSLITRIELSNISSRKSINIFEWMNRIKNFLSFYVGWQWGLNQNTSYRSIIVESLDLTNKIVLRKSIFKTKDFSLYTYCCTLSYFVTHIDSARRIVTYHYHTQFWNHRKSFHFSGDIGDILLSKRMDIKNHNLFYQAHKKWNTETRNHIQ